MRLATIHHYDTYVPILAELQTRHTWDQAVETGGGGPGAAGQRVRRRAGQGLRGRWCDRYENRGKQSGAFSSGSFDGDPYILMNYQPDVLDHVFTLAHEAGHSMHSYFSAKHQPFPYYHYVIFVAEVASTFNEQLLGRYLLEARRATTASGPTSSTGQIDAMRGTIFRQTMFAEFEKIAHALAEPDEPLTLGPVPGRSITGCWSATSAPISPSTPNLDLECLRIPHFYRGFYVYKYATGMSAAIALAERVTGGGRGNWTTIWASSRAAARRTRLDLLRAAGVDMEQPAAVDAALGTFGPLVEQLDALVG